MNEQASNPNDTLTIAAALESAARSDDGIFFQQEDGRVAFRSFCAIEADAWRVAGSLRERLGEGERVGIVLADPETFLDVFLGTVVAGLVPVLLSPPASLGNAVAQLRRQIELARPGLVVTTHGLLPVIAGAVAPGAIATPDELAASEPLRDRAPASPVALAFATGEGVRCLGAFGLAECVAALGGKKAMSLGSQDVVATLLPLSQPIGLLASLLAPLWRGASVLVLHPLAFLRAPLESLRLLSTYRTSACFLPASAIAQIVRRLTAADLAGLRLASMRVLGHAGEADAALIGALRALLADAGVTEAALVVGGRASRACEACVETGTVVSPPVPQRAPASTGAPRLRLSGSLFAVGAARQVNGPQGLRAAIGRALARFQE